MVNPNQIKHKKGEVITNKCYRMLTYKNNSYEGKFDWSSEISRRQNH